MQPASVRPNLEDLDRSGAEVDGVEEDHAVLSRERRARRTGNSQDEKTRCEGCEDNSQGGPAVHCRTM
jgi:hypothetical protein